MSAYRTGRHWGVTIVREQDDDQDQLVAVVVNGDQALAERICALLNADDRCWHGEHCDGSGPECERDAPLKGEHPAHPTCTDVSNLRAGQMPRSEWMCGPECPRHGEVI